jgi:phospholipid/cholesterol/gamma-HCH transport system substrate-binding protein
VSDYESAQRRRNIVVGVFVIVGAVAFGWLIFRFGEVPTVVSEMRSFPVYVQFPSAPGVQQDTPVRFCGYQIGSVTHVQPPAELEDLNTGQRYHQTVCIISINNRYNDVPSNVKVKLMTRGLGSSYIELQLDPARLPAPPTDPNRPETQYLVRGTRLQGSTGMTSEFFPEESQQKLNFLVEDIRAFIANLNTVIGDEQNQGNIKAILANVADASQGLSDAVDAAETTMAEAQATLTEYKELAAAGQGTLKDADVQIERLVASMVSTSAEVSSAISQLRLAMEKVNAGQGTAGRLISDARLYEGLLETVDQLNVILEDIRETLDTVSEKGLRSIY